MASDNQLGNAYASKKNLINIGIEVPEDALGFYVKDQILYFEVMDADNEMGMLMINVDTQAVNLTQQQYEKIKQMGYDSEEGFRLGV